MGAENSECCCSSCFYYGVPADAPETAEEQCMYPYDDPDTEYVPPCVMEARQTARL